MNRGVEHPLRVDVAGDEAICGARAAATAADLLRTTLITRGRARLVLATGASQRTLLRHLTAATGIDWSRVTVFHLDEYVGLAADHPASFRRYLRERFVDAVPAPLAAFHELDGTAPDPVAECARVGAILREDPIDVLLCGIGENAHLAFNDPPADFDTTEPFLVVDLDRACRNQQVGEGWFASLETVPTRALSMSIRQMLDARSVVCTAPDSRKARAVRATLEAPIGPAVPASALRHHPNCSLFLDSASAAMLSAR